MYKLHVAVKATESQFVILSTGAIAAPDTKIVLTKAQAKTLAKILVVALKKYV